MQNKLQELTDKLYNEGLAKGKQEADNLLGEARLKADDIVAEARAEAQKIVSDARREAEDLKSRVAGDIKMASTQTLAALRQQIEHMIETKAVGDKVDEALSDKQFVGKPMEPDTCQQWGSYCKEQSSCTWEQQSSLHLCIGGQVQYS